MPGRGKRGSQDEVGGQKEGGGGAMELLSGPRAELGAWGVLGSPLMTALWPRAPLAASPEGPGGRLHIWAGPPAGRGSRQENVGCPGPAEGPPAGLPRAASGLPGDQDPPERPWGALAVAWPAGSGAPPTVVVRVCCGPLLRGGNGGPGELQPPPTELGCEPCLGELQAPRSVCRAPPVGSAPRQPACLRGPPPPGRLCCWAGW